MSSDAPSYFVDVLARLAHDRVRFVVVGGVAVVLHGHQRPIADLDLVVDATPVEAQRAMQSLAAAGFVPSIPLPLTAVTVLRLFDAALREVDVFARYPVPFADLDRDAVDAQIDGVPLRIAALPQLLHAKRTFAREHDLWDVAAFAALAARQSDPQS